MSDLLRGDVDVLRSRVGDLEREVADLRETVGQLQGELRGASEWMTEQRERFGRCPDATCGETAVCAHAAFRHGTSGGVKWVEPTGLAAEQLDEREPLGCADTTCQAAGVCDHGGWVE